ncbi:MOSC domain-containing protein [Halobacterium sp. KA-6]|uniref:MOSC domain-containing protein n=1 Tax=Halobacterium sp. KA-6 TaxID=2896368 RepID=UPI001E3D4051|nr:MOSC domain-containing protein [Halobacterium sp. KA-6]MCD2202709.1 MOSC domain-containing protein [Halobacterium sp. KA-6]
MNGVGTAERIYTAPDAGVEMVERSDVEAVAGRGLRGDRYFSDIKTGTFVTWDADEDRKDGYDLTLIEAEAVEAIEREAGIELAPGEHRRNVVTRDVALNHLVGTRFRVGSVVCRGHRLCEPCGYLQDLLGEDVLDALAHRGGLRADVLETGVIRPGDTVEPLD